MRLGIQGMEVEVVADVGAVGMEVEVVMGVSMVV